MNILQVTIIGHWGGYPAPDGATSCYLVEKDDFSLVIDMGSGALSKLQTYRSVANIDAVILSHYHADHIADVGVLQHARLVHTYLQDDVEILPIYGHGENIDYFNTLTHKFTSGVIYNPNKTLEVGPFTISFLRTKHSVPCFGMRITDGEHTFVYTADTAYQEEWIPFAERADMLLVDCNFYADQDGEEAGHMTSAEGAYIAQQAYVKELILSHLPQYGHHEQLITEAKQNFTGTVHLAEEGLVWRAKN